MMESENESWAPCENVAMDSNRGTCNQGSTHEQQTQVASEGKPSLAQARDVVEVVLKILLVFLCLYMFICTLGLLEASFQLLGGKTAASTFSSGVLSNPIAGLMIGVLATVLVQSSSTSTSIVVSMVGAEVIPIRKAVPVIMGANVGTSVTNTLVSLTHVANRKDFRRAFAGATVHDAFNWMAVLLLLPIEMTTGYLYWLSAWVLDSMGLDGHRDKAPDMLKVITSPLLKAIVQVNKDTIRDTATGARDVSDQTVLKRWCGQDESDVTNSSSSGSNSSSGQALTPLDVNVTDGFGRERCHNLFAQTDLSDPWVGVILLLVALLLMTASLLLVVKTLNVLIRGPLVKVVKETLNSDLPGRLAFLTGYLAVLVGCGMTIVVQSSSVFTSTLTPLVGIGIISVERMYPMTLGSNIGTTVTSILAALSQSGDRLRLSLHIALCHLFFNITGFLMFYPIPCTRIPILMAKSLGDVTYKHRWFAILYLVLMFAVLPAFVFALSHAGWMYLLAIGGPLFAFFLAVIIVCVLQRKNPKLLPAKFRNWEFLPVWCRSLDPIDDAIERMCPCACCQKLLRQSAGSDDLSDLEELCVFHKENTDDKAVS